MTAKERAYVARLERKCSELEAKCAEQIRVYRDQSVELIELRATVETVRFVLGGCREESSA